LIVATAVVSAGATGYLVAEKVSKNYEEKLKVLGAQIEKKEDQKEILLNDAQSQAEEEITEEDLGVGGPYVVSILDTPTGFLRVREKPNGQEIAKVQVGAKLIYLSEEEDWFEVELEDGNTGWISKKYSVKE